MASDVEDLVIETGVDSMLDYLTSNRKASVSEISENIGVKEERVENWADALANQNLLEKHHTVTSGLVLEYSKKNLEETARTKAEIEKELQEESEDLKSDLSLTKDNIEGSEALENIDEDEAVEDIVDKLDNLEMKIDRTVDKEDVDEDVVKLISEVEEVLEEIETLLEKELDVDHGEKLTEKTEEAVSEVEDVLEEAEKRDKYDEDIQDIRKKYKAVKKLESNIEQAEKTQFDQQKGIKDKIISKTPFLEFSSDNTDTDQTSTEKEQKTSEDIDPEQQIDDSDKIKKRKVPEKTYRELVEENRVTDVMRKISLIKNPDYSSILKAEKIGRNREDLVEYLEERVEDE
jgi:transposase-like protein